MADFDAILNGKDIKNRRSVFEQMILSLLSVIYTLHISEETVRLLAEVLDKDADQYCARKLLGQDHNKAFEDVKEGLLKSVKAMLKRDRNADFEWMVISRLPLQLASAL